MDIFINLLLDNYSILNLESIKVINININDENNIQIYIEGKDSVFAISVQHHYVDVIEYKYYFINKLKEEYEKRTN